MSGSNVDHRSDSDVFAQVKRLGALEWGEHRPRVVATVYSQEAYNAIEHLCEQLKFPHDLILADKIESGSLVQIFLRPLLEGVLHQIMTKEAEVQLVPLWQVLPGR